MIGKHINWGWRITIFYSGFVLFMGYMVWRATTVHDDLVTPDYYAKELAYQELLDKKARTAALTQQPGWSIVGDSIRIWFPEAISGSGVKADILFYNTAEAKKDYTTTCQPNTEGICMINKAVLANGVYQMQINWQAGNTSYYNEGVINIQ